MYTNLIKLSKNLYALDFKKEAQEILILEGVDPAEIASALGLDAMPEEEGCGCPETPKEMENAPDFEELMEMLFGKGADKKKEVKKVED